MFYIQLLVVAIMFTLCVQITAEQCNSNQNLGFDECTEKVFQSSPGWRIRSSCKKTRNRNTTTSVECPADGLCDRMFRLSVFNQQLFAITMKNTVLRMLNECCSRCAKCVVVNEIDDLSFFNTSILNTSDIIFPVITESSIKKLYGFHFLPAFKAPSSYYFTMKKSNTRVMEEVILACAKMWPLLVTCLLFTTISGFIVWLIEARTNHEEFPGRFYVGMFEGFWWSFITMTTVGYGDKVPKTYAGRVYAIVWILLGLTICSMFTATLTTEILNAHTPSNTNMLGRNVGVLKDRLHDIACVAQHGGIINPGRIDHTIRGVNELIIMLQNKSIDGFLIDKNTYYHFSLRIKNKKYKYVAERMAKVKGDMIRTEKQYKEGSLSCGMLFKYESDEKYFRSYFENNHLHLRSCNSLRMNTKETVVDKQANLFADGSFFKSVLYYCLAMLGFMVCTGLLLEGKQYYYNRVNSNDR